MVYDAIVIGSGVGGLSCGAALSFLRKRVLVLEQHTKLGGYIQTFRRRHWTFDVGSHFVTDMEPGNRFHDLLAYLSDGALSFARLPTSFHKLVYPDFEYELVTNRGAMRARLEADFPGQTAALRTYWGMVDGANAHLDRYVLTKALPATVGRLLAGPLTGIYRSIRQRTLQQVLDDLFVDERLKRILQCYWPLLGTPPPCVSFLAYSVFQQHILQGTYYVSGDSISEAFREAIVRRGGEIATGTRVRRLLCRDLRVVGVETADGTRHCAHAVVSDIGIRETLSLMSAGCPASSRLLRAARRHEMRYTNVMLFVGLEGDLSPLHVYPTYRVFGPAPWDTSVDPSEPGWSPSSAFVSFTSLFDTWCDTNRAGRSSQTAEVIVPVDYRHFERWSDTPPGGRGADYAELKAKLTRDLLAVLARAQPGIESHVAFTDLATPLTHEHYTRRRRGSIYGFEVTPQRMADTDLVPRSGIRGLYFTGADVFMHGILQCFVSGLLTAGAIHPARFLLGFLRRGGKRRAATGGAARLAGAG